MIKANIIYVINAHVSGPKNISPERFHVFELWQFLAGFGYDALTDFIANKSLCMYRIAHSVLSSRFEYLNFTLVLWYSDHHWWWSSAMVGDNYVRISLS